jgi:uncharacterized protein (PEP-CTERM system associated)
VTESSLPEQSQILQPDQSVDGNNPNTYVGQGYNPSSLGVQNTGPYLGTTQSQQSSKDAMVNDNGSFTKNGANVDVTPYVQQSFTYSDNIDLAPDGLEEDGFVSSSTAGVDLSAKTKRLRALAGISVTYDHYFSDDGNQDDGFRPYGYLNSSLEAVDNFFYVDAFGTVTTRALSENTPFSSSSVANRDDQAIVYTGTISPAIRTNIGGFVNTELRYSHSRIEYSDDDIDRDGQFSNTFSAAVASDPRKFRRFGWNTRVEHEIYEYIGEGGDQVRTSASAGVDVPITQRTALFSNVGYDWFDPDLSFDGNDATGAFGNVGVRYNPSQRLATEAYLGFRYGGFDYGATAAYLLTKRMELSASVRRSIETGSINSAPVDYRSGLLLGSDGQLIPVFRRDDFRNNENPSLNVQNFSDFYTANFDDAFLVNGITGQTGTINDPGFGIIDSSTLRDTATVRLLGATAGGLRYTVAGIAENRQYSFDRDDEFVLGGRFNIEKDITTRLTLGGNASYTRFEGDEFFDTDSDTMSFGLSANYLLTPMISTFATYSFTQRFADESISEYTENAGTIGLRASF